MHGIEWRQVGKRYGATTIIESFSLVVEPGEFVALLGPSGCGKTTLLRMLAGLETVTSGQVLIGGRDVTHLPPGQRGLAMVFQQYALYPHMSVRDNMAFGLRNSGVATAEIDTRIAAAAKMLELDALLARRPAQLSGGQRQRVAIGRAVVKEPSAFLFDEPMSNLDAALRSRTRVELARLHKRLKATMLLVTHDQVEAMTLADRVVVMNQGRIEQVATPIEAYRRPATRFVAGFVGSPPMSFVPLARRQDAAGATVFELPGGASVATHAPLPPGEGWVLGLRPEALALSDGTNGGVAERNGVPATVEVVERLGERTLVHASLADGTLVVANARGAAEPDVGQRITLRIDPQQAHFFDSAGSAHRH
jgi:multiple sugar transport system ATP-binding protein